ncbi:MULTISPECIES: acetyl-CoA C-acetyltransferase [unclassified Psychrobacter]|uniref:acetyl-CoA C-acetyltransferase n=1 Tax=unclassified Psychrobacter TaxID=196806 RepID=UPI00071E75EE|nr:MULTISPECIES: acetyl-CoA C-acetyltransferase [unclassified Psychrobacter]OLF39522.1 acetyl-CoA acetyltransferase [Psychrobacter sp. Cmf 22.2]
MSNKKNSPIVESTVVKGNTPAADSTQKDTQPNKDDQQNNAHYDSIAELKEATDIVDADGNAENDQAQKKAKIKEDLVNESDLSELEDTNVFDTTAQSEASETRKDDTQSQSIKSDDRTDTNTDEIAAKTSKSNTASKKSRATKLSSGQHRVAILGGNRIPFARSNGPYADASNIDMLTAALNGLIERYNLQDERVGEVVAGAVLKLSRDLNLTREAALNTALDPHTPTYDVSQACGTGLQSAFASANKIALGVIDSAITGGVDTTSDAPLAVGDGLRKVILKLGAARNNKQRLQALMGLNPKDLIESPQNGEPRTGLSMGEHQAITALEWNISREDQDELAFNSHKNLARAYDEGFFDDLITPYKGLTRDNNLRPDSTLEKMGKLKPVFGKKNANPTMTAANSTPLTDGASCVLLANDEWAEAHGLKPLAYIVHQETAAVDFIGKSGNKEGLLMAPAYAVPRMLERAGLTLQDFDFYEIHEAFASQVLSTLAAWEDETFCQERLGLEAPLGSIDRSKLNVNGSSLAAGHPFAATGGRILATAAKLLDQKGSGRALISICAAGGQGVTCILEK